MNPASILNTALLPCAPGNLADLQSSQRQLGVATPSRDTQDGWSQECGLRHLSNKMRPYLTPQTPHLFPHIPLSTSPFQFRAFKKIIYKVQSVLTCVHGCQAIHWSMGILSVGIPSTNSDSPSPAIHNHLVRGRDGDHLPHLCWNWDWLDLVQVLCR